MSDEVFKQHGAVSWVELMTSDVEGAKSFYSQLFGWQLETMQIQEGMPPYNVISAGDMKIGGIMATPPEAGDTPPRWGNYVTVDDVDAVAVQAAELGGKLLFGPQDIPTVGRFCIIQDPQGAVISAITYVSGDKD